MNGMTQIHSKEVGMGSWIHSKEVGSWITGLVE